MMGNYHVRFLEEQAAVTQLAYSIPILCENLLKLAVFRFIGRSRRETLKKEEPISSLLKTSLNIAS
jgi:hypothetical protein